MPNKRVKSWWERGVRQGLNVLRTHLSPGVPPLRQHVTGRGVQKDYCGIRVKYCMWVLGRQTSKSHAEALPGFFLNFIPNPGF